MSGPQNLSQPHSFFAREISLARQHPCLFTSFPSPLGWGVGVSAHPPARSFIASSCACCALHQQRCRPWRAPILGRSGIHSGVCTAHVRGDMRPMLVAGHRSRDSAASRARAAGDPRVMPSPDLRLWNATQAAPAAGRKRSAARQSPATRARKRISGSSIELRYQGKHHEHQPHRHRRACHRDRRRDRRLHLTPPDASGTQ